MIETIRNAMKKRVKAMPQINDPDTATYWLIGILTVILLPGFFVKLCIFINDFSETLRYLTGEIKRTVGDERRYYIRERRRLWLSLIPFVRFRKYD